MAVRRESIILELEDNASAEALRAAAGLKALDASINKLSGSATRTRAFQGMSRDVDSLGKSLDRTGSSIDTYSGRLGILGTAAMALGPALLPIGAVGVPAVASLAAGMGAAAGAAGVMMLALNGVGEAVTAVSDYRLEPTAQNLAKVREEMERLGPEAASFVMAIDRATPALEDLQRTARAGMFPGWERGLDQLMTQLPGVRDFVSDLSVTVGELGEASADALVNDADWQEFFDLIGTDGPSALEDFGRATGNVVAGAANLAEALSELTGNRAGLVENSRAFREWADNLENTQGFQEFADYVRESGPQVAEFLTATGEAMVAVAQAAAPWGQAVLPVLTSLAEVTTAIASSPLGPPLFAAAAAMLVFNKAAAASSMIMGRVGPSIDGMRTSLGQMKTDLNTVAGGWVLASSATEREAKKMAGAQARLKAIGSEAARTGPALAAMALMASGASEKMGLTNTAVLTMAGSMAGPWGTAAGFAVGTTMDLAQATDDLAKAVENANGAMKTGGLEELTAQAKELQATLKETTDSDVYGFDMFGAGFINAIAPLTNKSKYMALFTGDAEKAAEALEKIQAQKAGMEDLAVALGANRDSAEQMSSGVDRAQTAMKALGISNADLVAVQRAGGVEFDLLADRIQAWVQSADSAAGRTDTVGDAVAQLGAEAISTADSASALSAALDALISPEQNLIATQDALTTSIRHLGDDMDKQNKTLRGNSDAAIQNRAAISGRVDDLKAMIAAEAEAGRGPEVVANSLDKQREALVRSAVAAGANKKEVESLLNTYNLTPELVKTVFESAGIDENEQKARNLYDAYARLPKSVKTDIKANGIPKSEADISRLQKKYNLTPAQVRTLASLKDAASGPIASILRQLINLDGKTATTTVINRTINEVISISRGQSTRPDRRVEPGQYSADGGEVLGQRYPYGDKVTVALAPGEEVITNRNGEADRYRRDRAMGLIPAYADGGTIGIPGYAKGGTVRGAPTGSLERSLDRLGKRLERAGHRIERAMSRTEKAIDRNKEQLEQWNQKRDALKSAVTGSLERNWFGGNTGNVWSDSTMSGGTVAFAQQQWKQQAADSKKLAAIIANLRKNGAGDAFIAEILGSEDPLAAADMFNKQSVGGMRHSQKLYLSATKATASAANSTSSIYADEQRKNTLEIRGLRSDLARLDKQLDRNHKEAEATRKRESAAKASSKGARDRR